MPLKVIRVREGGAIYRIEREGKYHIVDIMHGDERVRVAKIKGSYDAARETCRWHAKKRHGVR